MLSQLASFVGRGAGKQPQTTRTKGQEIRASIAANRAKRLAIAEAMKTEAGVTGHEINTEDFSGLAYIGTGRIRSPAGENMRNLYIVAHECGHIFLHNDGLGYRLPPHVKELEAESYAHQAFREHGMELPRMISDWGRLYVGSWIAKDRAAGIAIDPRALAYANGARSPYEPLRKTPPTWTTYRGLQGIARRALDDEDAAWRAREQDSGRQPAGTWNLKSELRAWGRTLFNSWLVGHTASLFVVHMLGRLPGSPEMVLVENRTLLTFEGFVVALVASLHVMSCAALWRTMRR